MNDQMTAENIEKVDSVRLDILGCTSEAEIEDVFLTYDVTDYEERTMFLFLAMEIRAVYGIDDNTVPAPTTKEIYEYYRKYFLDGEWKDFV